MDKTAPVIAGVSTVINETTDSSQLNSSLMSIVTAWKVEDLESNIKACYCALGIPNYTYLTLYTL